jgi:integrase
VAADGVFNDGGGLALVVIKGSAAWRFRYSAPSGQRRDAGLGNAVRDSVAAAGASLKNARAQAERMRAMIREGKDPLDERDRARAEAKAEKDAAKSAVKAQQLTLRRHVRQYHTAYVEPFRARKTSVAWLNSIEQGLPATLLDCPVIDVQATDVLDALVALSKRVPETGSRVATRLAAALDQAVLAKVRADNPVRPVIKEVRRRIGPRVSAGYPSLPAARLPAFVKQLREAPGTAGRSLELLILTACRSGEILGLEWSEVDLDNRTLTIRGDRMKTARTVGRNHVVYLADRALRIIEGQIGQHPTVVFPSVTGSGKPQSSMAMEMLMRRLHRTDVEAGGRGYADPEQQRQATPHGFRHCHSTWANEVGYRPDVIEAALSHVGTDRIRATYNRARYEPERRQLAAAWARFCETGEVPPTNVLQLPVRAA